MLPLGKDALFKKSIYILSIRYFDKATCECVTNDSNAQNNGCNILNLLKIFALTHFEIHIKKILVTCAVMQRCFDLEVSAGENCPFHLSFLPSHSNLNGQKESFALEFSIWSLDLSLGCKNVFAAL